MWRRSWLSREVLLFSIFSMVAGVYAATLWLGVPGGSAVGALTAAIGIAGVTASGCIYRVPSRPSWNTPYTLLQFNLTAGILGPLFAAVVGGGNFKWVAAGAATMAGAQFVLLALALFRCVSSDSLELRGTARLLSTVLARPLVVRGVLLALGAIVLPLLAGAMEGPAAFDFAQAKEAGHYVLLAGPVDAGRYVLPLALVLAVAGEILGRYLFFVSAVPKHLAAPYIASAGEAA
jgi:DMSO reductase anchor subunit